MFVVGWWGCVHRAPEVPVEVDGFALVDVTVWVGDGSPPRPDHTVLVLDGRIAAVGPVGTVEVPPTVRTVAGEDRFVMPGLADNHAHLPDAEPDDTITTDQALALYVARGVTTVRSMRGTPAQLVLRDRIAAGEVRGPRLIVGAVIGDVAAEAVPAQIAEVAAAGYDFVKLMGVDRAGYAALVDAARAHGLPLAGHVPSGVPLDDVLAAGQCVEHLQSLSGAVRDGADPVEVAVRVREAGVWNCPTLDYAAATGGIVPLAVLDARAGLDRVPVADRERWRAEIPASLPEDPAAFQAEYTRRQKLLRALAENGAGLLATGNHGPFMVPGYGMREELARWEEAGVTRERALVAANQGATAAWFGADGWGDLTVGHVADLVVLDRSPLEDLDALGEIHAVVLAGRWQDGAAP